MGLRPARRELLLEQLATMLDSGLPLAGAWQRLPESGKDPAIGGIGRRLARGWSLEDALDRAARDGQAPFSTWEIAWLAAGERSGTLPATCARLAAHWSGQRETMARIRSGLVYPAGLVLLMLLVAPVDRLIAEGMPGYLQALAALMLRALGLLALVGLAAGFAGRSPRLREAGLLVWEHVPILGKPWKLAGEIRLTRALAAMWQAGVALDQAWPVATLASGSPGLPHAGEEAASAILRGEDPDAALASIGRRYGAEWVAAYTTGESTGRLDETLERHARRRDGELDRALATMTRTVSQTGYLIVAAMLVQKIAGMYAGAMDQVNGALRDIY
ncbi:MAG: type II secretion system F family protein [Candidatus Sericytochromatia bacterium]|nr:type II secretion system F family protein [Candidatus Sericytochromatia bacterium]